MKIALTFPVCLALIALTFAHFAWACTIVSNVDVTFYGYPNNDPPGNATAYSCGLRGFAAGGTGNYSDPLSFASADGEYNQCEIVYLPYLKKYLRMDDYCQDCSDEFLSGIKHIVVWTGSGVKNGGQAQLNCQSSLIPAKSQSVIRQPAHNLTVNLAPLFNVSKILTVNKCNINATFPNNIAGSYCAALPL